MYGYLELVPQALDGLLGKLFGGDRIVFRHLCKFCPGIVCHEAVGKWYRAWKAVGIIRGIADCEANPDMFQDWIEGHPDEWRLVWSQGDILCRQKRRT